LYMCTTSDTFADCYSKADKALYNVKQNGKNHFSFYHQISHSSSDSPGTARDLQQVADALRKSGSYAQHHKLKEKMERNLFAGSFHCVKI